MPRPGAGEALPAGEIVPTEALHFGRPGRVMNLCRVGQEDQIPPSANGEALRSRKRRNDKALPVRLRPNSAAAETEALRSNEKGGSASFLSPFSQPKRFLPKDGL